MKTQDNVAESVKNDRLRNDALNKSDNSNDLPGNYSPKEDIMNRKDTQRVGIDVENFSRTPGHRNIDTSHEPLVLDPVADNLEGNFDRTVNGDVDIVDELEQPLNNDDMEHPVPKGFKENDELEFATGNESDVTTEDLEALGPKDLSMDMGEDEELLKHRVYPVDMAGEDLDIPTAEDRDDDLNEAIGPEDEENDFYSLGGDRLEDNMEGK